MVEGGVQEEAVVIEREVLARLTDAALAERHELLALGERAHRDCPFLEGDWHRRSGLVEGEKRTCYLGLPARKHHGRRKSIVAPADPRVGHKSHTMHKVAK